MFNNLYIYIYIYIYIYMYVFCYINEYRMFNMGDRAIYKLE